jgi:hypothetical protein
MAVVQVSPHGIEDGSNDDGQAGHCPHLGLVDGKVGHDGRRERADQQLAGLVEEQEQREHERDEPAVAGSRVTSLHLWRCADASDAQQDAPPDAAQTDDADHNCHSMVRNAPWVKLALPSCCCIVALQNRSPASSHTRKGTCRAAALGDALPTSADENPLLQQWSRIARAQDLAAALCPEPMRI